MTPARKSTTRANGRQLRSSSSVGQCDSTSGSYPSVLGDFVFPYPDRGAARQQSTTPSIAPTESLDLRSPRLSLPASANTNTIAEVPPQPRARSYTVGGGSCKSRHRGHRNSNGLVITASMAGAGGAALFGNHVRTSSMSHAESYASRNSDRSLSLSSIPAASGRGGVTVHAVTGVAGATTLLHSAVNTMREGTPVNAATTAMLQVPVEPTTPPPQPPRLQQRPPLTPCAVGMPAQQGGSTHKSESFVTQRSASSDFVNGLDDSADSVLCGSTPLRPSTNAFCGPTGTYRYAMDSIAGDGGLLPHSGTPSAADGRRPRRYSITLADDDDNAHNASSVSTLDRLRSRRDGRNPHNSNAAVATRPMPMTAAPHSHTHARCAEHLDASSEPKTAIERWRAQEEQKRREESTPVQRHRLSARQWREAFHRLEENRLKWTMRSFIGAGTSGKVYEGVLEDAAHTPVAVKVLDVGVPMPVGPSTVATANEDGNMSPDQQEALLVLLREVEMMEKLHQRNIVTCLRCQVTPVHDRFMELHHKQQQQQPHRPSSLARPSDGAGSDDVKGVRHNANASPQRSPTAAAATRIPVQVEIIMELCKRGTLASVVRRSPGGQLPVVTARRYLRDVLKGLAYLHGNNFIHRDVKGENVLISADDVAKLADFGCSRRIVMTNSHVPGEGHDGTMSSIATTHATDSRYTTMVDYQWCEATGVAQTMVGTPMFMAPEIIQASGASPATPCSADSTEHGSGNTHHNNVHHGSAAAAAPLGYTASADIWSFGCLVLEVFGRTPWPTAGNNVYRLMKQIEQSVDDMPPGVPQNTPQELLDVLRRCFRRDPHRRSTARMLLRSTWMTCKDEELEEMPSRRQR
ncbi:serine/threonine protein kinase-like protein [Leptomonas seymouri]|uniref:Serine/threonine protein kinase-like protein n=1 Tax=Leptomonas seymouri TaxID=5684 RepID=A0A0N0P3I6_LEPSE|nr:serine/threonine protein kinase-like protein [Leptomonas seymouri]|eukprot:KPI84176.1 serine/threonine protein kinase-like protein [Leptomonas seymouri]